MAGLPQIVLPLALRGALVAGISLTGRGRSERGPRGNASRGARWARRRDLRPLRVAADGAPPGRLLLGVLPGVARPAGLAAATAQALGGACRARQRQERSPAAHLGDPGAPGSGVVHRSDRFHGSARQYLVTADRL